MILSARSQTIGCHVEFGLHAGDQLVEVSFSQSLMKRKLAAIG